MATLTKDIFWAQQACGGYRNFKVLGDYKLNFSCPICGDSKKDERAARCYVYPSSNMILKVKCHNCEYGPEPISNFLKLTNPQMYKQYILSRFEDEQKLKPQKKKVEPKLSTTPFKHLVQEAEMELVPAKNIETSQKYVESRKIPKSTQNRIFYHKNYTKWAVDKFNREVKFIPKTDERVVLICKGTESEMIGTIGRTITNSSLRYNNIKVNDAYPNLVYGLDRINTSTQIRVVEGAFDSLFVDNCIAISSSALGSSVQYAPKDKTVLIWDNEPRNKEICSGISRAIEAGHRVVIWPQYINAKDINAMVLYDGVSDVDALIDDNTYSGLMAKIKFSDWKKI